MTIGEHEVSTSTHGVRVASSPALTNPPTLHLMPKVTLFGVSGRMLATLHPSVVPPISHEP